MRWISCRIRCKAKPEPRLKQHVRSPVTFVLDSNLPKGSNFFIMNTGERVFSICGRFTSQPHAHTHRTDAERWIQNKPVKGKMTFGSCWRIVKLLNLSEQHLCLRLYCTFTTGLPFGQSNAALMDWKACILSCWYALWEATRLPSVYFSLLYVDRWNSFA